MFYKVLKNNKVIDLLNHIVYLKRQKKNNLMVACSKKDAEAIMSSDEKTIWKVEGLNISKDNFDIVELVEIDEYEYKQLKALNGKTPEEIIDAYTLLLIEGGLI